MYKIAAVVVMVAVLVGFGPVLQAAEPLPPVMTSPAMAPPPAPGAPPPPGPAAGPPAPPPPPAPPAAAGVMPALQTATQALATARAVVAHLVPGKVWLHRAPAGELEIKAGLVYQGTVVGTLMFSPADAALLPKGMHIPLAQARVNPSAVASRLGGIISRLRVAPGAEWRDPERCWVVPVVCDGMIVAEIKVFMDGRQVLPDYPAAQEMAAASRLWSPAP